MSETRHISTRPEMSPDISPNEVVCACIGLTRDKLGEILANDPGLTFEGLMRSTGAGGKCTACMLDLEYYFVSLSRNAAHRTGAPNIEEREHLGFKRILFNLIDSISPLVPLRLADRMPLLLGPGIEQYVWVANQTMADDKPISAPPMRVSLVVRDSLGRIVETYEEVLQPGTYMRKRVGSGLVHSEHGGNQQVLSAASVEIVRQATSSGFRGTTRPQTEVVSSGGNCAVHSQRPGMHKEQWITVLHRPGTERIFITVVNPNNSPITARFAFPFPFPLDGHPTEQIEEDVIIPAQGAHCQEIHFKENPALEGAPVGIRWRVSGRYKSHLVCADPTLSRISIDHV